MSSVIGDGDEQNTDEDLARMAQELREVGNDLAESGDLAGAVRTWKLVMHEHIATRNRINACSHYIS